jgi:hypothetical protein
MENIDITTRIEKYLPKFINAQGEIAVVLFLCIAKELKKIYDELESFKDDSLTGRGLLHTVKDNEIFFDSSQSFVEADLQAIVKQALEINNERGTESGIIGDLNNFCRELDCEWEDITPEGVIYFDPIIDVTYYTDEYYALDLQKVIIIDQGDGLISLSEQKKQVIRHKFIPIDTTVIFI